MSKALRAAISCAIFAPIWAAAVVGAISIGYYLVGGRGGPDCVAGMCRTGESDSGHSVGDVDCQNLRLSIN